MDYATPSLLAAAVRASIGELAAAAEDNGPRRVLQRSVEHRLFTTATIASPSSCVNKTLSALTTDVGRIRDDEAVAELWTEALITTLQGFTASPESWTDRGTETFLRRAGSTFGVDDEKVLPLLREFHSRSDSCRFAVQVALIRSPMFDYIKRVLGELPPEFDMQIDDPQDSMRSLLKAIN